MELSAERMEQGGTVAAAFTGMVGETAPTVETDLGNVQAVRLGSGWRAYIPAAYNAAAGAHEVTFTVGGETVVKNITVIPKDFGTLGIRYLRFDSMEFVWHHTIHSPRCGHSDLSAVLRVQLAFSLHEHHTRVDRMEDPHHPSGKRRYGVTTVILRQHK